MSDGGGGGGGGNHGEGQTTRERKKGVPWTEEEHRMFLLGLHKLGKGDWRGISRSFVQTRTPTQVASHAQKYFIRQSNMNKRKRRSSLFDIGSEGVGLGMGRSMSTPSLPTLSEDSTSQNLLTHGPLHSQNSLYSPPSAFDLSRSQSFPEHLPGTNPVPVPQNSSKYMMSGSGTGNLRFGRGLGNAGNSGNVSYHQMVPHGLPLISSLEKSSEQSGSTEGNSNYEFGNGVYNGPMRGHSNNGVHSDLTLRLLSGKEGGEAGGGGYRQMFPPAQLSNSNFGNLGISMDPAASHRMGHEMMLRMGREMALRFAESEGGGRVSYRGAMDSSMRERDEDAVVDEEEEDEDEGEENEREDRTMKDAEKMEENPMQEERGGGWPIGSDVRRPIAYKPVLSMNMKHDFNREGGDFVMGNSSLSSSPPWNGMRSYSTFNPFFPATGPPPPYGMFPSPYSWCPFPPQFQTFGGSLPSGSFPPNGPNYSGSAQGGSTFQSGSNSTMAPPSVSLKSPPGNSRLVRPTPTIPSCPVVFSEKGFGSSPDSAEKPGLGSSSPSDPSPLTLRLLEGSSLRQSAFQSRPSYGGTALSPGATDVATSPISVV